MCYRWGVENARVAEIFDELAARLDVLGESSLKTRAYRSFAVAVRELERPLADLASRGELHRVRGGGRAMTQKVEELLARGTFAKLERARAETPSALMEMMAVPGVGAKTARALWKDAHVVSAYELAMACDDDQLVAVRGFGLRRQKALSDVLGIEGAAATGGDAVLLAIAREAGDHLGEALRSAGARRVEVVGEARRGLELVRSLELVASGLSAAAVARAIRAADDDLLVRDVEEHGDHAVVVHLQLRGSALVHVVHDDDFLLEVVTRTGSEAHVRWLRDLAGARAGGFEALVGRSETEEEVYAALDVPFTPPELRTGPSPHVPARLLAADGVRGVFHVHTDWSDGAGTLTAMARAAARAGFSYVGISDHSQAASYARGLDAKRLAAQRDAVARAREEIDEITILHGVEVDVMSDGGLDLDDDALAALDFVIASVHSHFAMSAREMTDRLVRAVSHPLVTILGHPTGRLLQAKRGYPFDVEAVARAAAANDTYLEINANAQRLDLSPPLVRRANEAGARFCVNPDAHAPRGMADVALGAMVARRAGVETANVLNALDRNELVERLAARKAHALSRLGRA